MSAPLLTWIERSSDLLSAQLADRLFAPSGGVLRAAGEAATRDVARKLIEALRKDLVDTGDAQLRSVVREIVNDYLPKGLGFYDLRLIATSMRNVVHAALDDAPDVGVDDLRRLDDWLHQGLLFISMTFVARREKALQEKAAEIEVKQLEAQLSELREVLAEKTQLLEIIRQASTPIAPVYDGILVVPLVGVLDPVRAAALTEKLLHAIVDSQAQAVILDISGVPIFDTATAHHILNAAKATALLGAEIVLVGMSAPIAQTVVHLDVDLSRLVTRSTLRDGLAYALAQRRLRIVPVDAIAQQR